MSWYPTTWDDEVKSGHIDHIDSDKKIKDFTIDEMNYITKTLEIAIDSSGWVHKPNSYLTKDINQLKYGHIKCIIRRYITHVVNK